MKRTLEQRERMSAWQQRNYELISPDGRIFHMKTKELKEFLPRYNLIYSKIMAAKKNGKKYKGWQLKEINELPNPVKPKKPRTDF